MFDWADYLALASELAKRSEDEAAMRSAVSRAYYAVFGRARERLRAEGLAAPRRATHRFVWDAYQQAREPHRRQVGAAGDRLRKYREGADYEGLLPGLPLITRRSIEIARELLSLLER